MSTVSVPNTFVNATPADADEVNANFGALVSAVNNDVVHVDGTKAMTGDFDAGSNKVVNVTSPTENTDAANKTYVDSTAAAAVPTAIFERSADLVIDSTTESQISFQTETNDYDGMWASGPGIVIQNSGVYAVSMEAQFNKDVDTLSNAIAWCNLKVDLHTFTTLGSAPGGNKYAKDDDDVLSSGGVYFLRAGAEIRATLQMTLFSGSESVTLEHFRVSVTKLAEL